LRQLLTESVVLSAAGGAAGVLLALGITRALIVLMPQDYLPNEARITINAQVLAFSAAISVLTGILFGLAPAIRSSRPDLVDALKEAGRAAGNNAGWRIRSALVVVEIALSVILLMGAGLTIRGFQKLLTVDPGFRADRLMLMGFQLSPRRYSTYGDRTRFDERLEQALASIPGVQAVAIGNGGLPYGGGRSRFSIEGQAKDDSRLISLNLVSSGYRQTLGIALRAGRDLSTQEIERAEPVALVNEAAARLWASGHNPIGSRIHVNSLEKPGLPAAPSLTPLVTIVGVIADTRNDGLRNPAMPAVFVPYTVIATPGRTFAIRTQAPPLQFVNAVRQRVREIDPLQPLGSPITLKDALGFQTEQPRFNMALFGFFGFVGLALAAAGIYSMLSYTVARRTQEIGIRMALGAVRGDVLGLMLRMAGRLVLIGLVAGLAGSIFLVGFLRSEVFLVPGTDPVAIMGAICVLAAVSAIACLVPAARAARLDPMSALRHE
ncbi:MAG: ABC transporter permease, partial [Acidobacteriota bacterium]|nr:ABC transporter permease [Acidobacteriota bacterium]